MAEEQAKEDPKKTLPLGSGSADDSGDATEELRKEFKLDADAGGPEVPEPPKPEELPVVSAGVDYFTELSKVRALMDKWLKKHEQYKTPSDPREAELAKRFMTTRKEMAELLGNLILDAMKKYRKDLERIAQEDLEIETFQKSRRFLDLMPQDTGQDTLIAEIGNEHNRALLESLNRIGKKLVSLLEESSFEDALEEYKKATIFIQHLIKDEETKKAALESLNTTLAKAINAYRKYFFEKGALEEDAENKFNKAYEFMHYITDKDMYKKAHHILEEIQFIIRQAKTASAAMDRNERFLKTVLERFAREGAEKKGLAAFLLKESTDDERVDFFVKVLEGNEKLIKNWYILARSLLEEKKTEQEIAQIKSQMQEIDKKLKLPENLASGSMKSEVFQNPEQVKIITLDIGKAYTSFILTNAALKGTIAHAPAFRDSTAWKVLKKRHEHIKKVHSELMRKILKAVKQEIAELMKKEDRVSADTLLRAAKPWRDSNMSTTEWDTWAKPLDRLRDWIAESTGAPTTSPGTTPSGGSMPSGLKEIEKQDIEETMRSVSRRIDVKKAIDNHTNIDINEGLCDSLEISVSKLDSILARSDIDAQTRADAEKLRTRIEGIAKDKINNLYPQVVAASKDKDEVKKSDFLLIIHRMANLLRDENNIASLKAHLKDNWHDDVKQMLKNLVWGLGGGVGYLIRLIIDKEMREHEIRNAPDVIKVLTKALASKGKSLLDPRELAVIFRYAFTNPNAPPTLQKWARRMVTEKKIENLFRKESGLLNALKNDMRKGSKMPPPIEGE